MIFHKDPYDLIFARFILWHDHLLVYFYCLKMSWSTLWDYLAIANPTRAKYILNFRFIRFVFKWVGSRLWSRVWDLEAGHSILRIFSLLAFLSMHCVSLHWREYKLRWISILKPRLSFCVSSLTTTYYFLEYLRD